jgi:hypothetical protein
MLRQALSELLAKLARIETLLEANLREKTVKEYYTTAEVAEIVGKAEYTVREWCRTGRVLATKKNYARGPHPEWLIAHAELQRLRNEGLRPVSAPAVGGR